MSIKFGAELAVFRRVPSVSLYVAASAERMERTNGSRRLPVTRLGSTYPVVTRLGGLVPLLSFGRFGCAILAVSASHAIRARIGCV